MRAIELLGRGAARILHAAAGMEGVARLLQVSLPGANPAILRAYGARIGRNAVLHSPLILVNAGANLQRLTIGDDCHTGKDVLLDLASNVVIGDRVTVSMRASIITHLDVGASVLQTRGFPRRVGDVHLEDDVYVGANAVILAGVTIGRASVVAAGAVVTQNVPPESIVAGVPARVVRGVDPSFAPRTAIAADVPSGGPR